MAVSELGSYPAVVVGYAGARGAILHTLLCHPSSIPDNFTLQLFLVLHFYGRTDRQNTYRPTDFSLKEVTLGMVKSLAIYCSNRAFKVIKKW